ncbi:MAG: hypothetical protein AABW80_04150 [Nanoarchaeota archaeon]
MVMDAQTLARTKENIINFIKRVGPSLPIHIAKDARTSPLFASAFLSELYREQKLIMSHLKVGSSPLYLLRGQEQMLEKFTQYLNQKEQEAFSLIKQHKILEDEKLLPAIRVAIREIKDFALPFRATIGTEQKIFWKYTFIPDIEVELMLNSLATDNQLKQDKTLEKKEIKMPVREQKEENKGKITENISVSQQPTIQQDKQEKAVEQKTKRIKENKPKIADSKFLTNLKDYLSAKDIEILHIVEEKTKEFLAKIRINDSFGKQEYFLIAKDKKKVKEEDLTHVLHKAQNDKMLALFMAPGELDKKALEFIKDYRNLVKFEKLKF